METQAPIGRTGIILANVLSTTYLIVAAVTQGRRSVHDFAVSTEVRRAVWLMPGIG